MAGFGICHGEVYGRSPESIAKEASIATKLHHPNIVPILGCLHVHGGANALLMELMSSYLPSYVQAINVSTWFSGHKITPFQPLVAVDMRYLHENRP
jgi:serine/threonine protein kinase